MKAMILAAGIGSRLDPLTGRLPKPMVPIANRPVMEHIIQRLVAEGFEDIIINIHYLQENIVEYFADGSRWGARLDYSLEESLLGTAGGVKRVGERFDDTFVVIGGDDLTSFSLSRLLDFHRRRGSLATIGLSEVEEPSSFGIVVSDEKGGIESFQEKPDRQEARSRMANTGIYVFEPEVLGFIPRDEPCDFARGVFPRLLELGLPFYGLASEDYWCDVGTLRQYRDANHDVLEGRCPVESCGISPRADISGAAAVEEPAAIGPGAIVERGARIGPRTVVGADCRISAGADVSDAVLWESCLIGSGASLRGCVLGRGCRIGRDAVVGDMAVLGDGCSVPDGSRIEAGTRLAAGTEFGQG